MSTVAPISQRLVFLGWDAPALPAAVAKLLERYRLGGTLDLGQVIVAVPGQRAGRRLLELLVDGASREGLRFTPPKIITEGALPELLYSCSKPIASPLVQRLAWSKSVQGLNPTERAALLPHPPSESDHRAWLGLGETLGRVHGELAADGLDADKVLSKGRTSPEPDRWQALRSVHRTYRTILAEHGLADRDDCRLGALERDEVRCDSDIVLLGTVDLNSVLVSMLDRVANRVTAFVFAPEEMAGRFDGFGRLIPAEWQSVEIPLSDDQIFQADDPRDQAEAAARWLGDFDGRFRADEVVMGVPDPAVVPAIRRRLGAENIRVRWIEGQTIADSGPYRMLAAAMEYADGRRYDAFAALLRHPDVTDWLETEGIQFDPSDLDRFHAVHLPMILDVEDNRLVVHPLLPVVERIATWLEPASGTHGLRDWAGIFETTLKQIYVGGQELDADLEADRVRYAALEGMIAPLEALREVPASLDRPFAATDAFAVAFEGLAREPIPPPVDPEAIQLLGWLELALDDAPAALVTTFNEGHVPSAAGADPFLPDGLRELLGLEHNARRYARDAYATTVLARSKKELACIVARRDSERYPLAPSRLLFTGSDAELIARAGRWVATSDESTRGSTSGNGPKHSPFFVPRPENRGAKPKEFAVTEFKDYLACKYRYYLKHVRELEALRDDDRELNGGAFGSLLHKALGQWGNDPNWRGCADAEPLTEHLIERLSTLTKELYGRGRPAIRLQLAQAERRLRGFAKCQVGLIAEGWQIVYAESENTSMLKIDFPIGPAESVKLRGRIDRIDYHAGQKKVRILDYKTGDEAKAPDKTHLKNGKWIDLQLPLYRHLWRQAVPTSRVPEPDAVELAYFQIPRDWDTTDVAVAKDWNLDEADQTAQTVIAGILTEDFWPPSDPAPDYSEAYSAICLDNLREPGLGDDDQEGSP